MKCHHLGLTMYVIASSYYGYTVPHVTFLVCNINLLSNSNCSVLAKIQILWINWFLDAGICAAGAMCLQWLMVMVPNNNQYWTSSWQLPSTKIFLDVSCNFSVLSVFYKIIPDVKYYNMHWHRICLYY